MDWALVRKLAICCVAALGAFAAFRQGLIPPKYSPLPAIVFENPYPILVDWQLRELGQDDALCRGMLSSKHVTGKRIADRPIENGCGWTNAIRMSAVGGARFPAARVNCGVAGGMALWMVNVVQPAAQKYFGQPVIAMRQMGVYNCRNIIGNSIWSRRRSQHATANAVDVGAFRLKNGRQIVIRKAWKGQGKDARFLREIFEGACPFFRVALSPNYNAAHHDHFHFDRGPFWRCR
ncbi:MAG: extensin family protein [Pseudomonadota bacterium]